MRTFNTIGIEGQVDLTPYNSDYINQYSLAAGVAEIVAWPEGASKCNIVGDASYATRSGGTAVVPVADITDGTGSALRVSQRKKFPNETGFSIISATAQVVTIEFWA